MSKKVLMCRPTYYDIEYEINDWMHTDDKVDHRGAARQWQAIYDVYTQKLDWEVVEIEPVKGLPDMVFTANGGLVLKNKVVLPHFRNPERQPETEVFKKWFQAAGYSDIYLPKYDFEGEGDAFAWHEYLFVGYPWRTDKVAHREVADYLGLKPISLQQASGRFYHLDTALTFINDDTAAVYPGAFTDESLESLRRIIPKLIEASDEDAMAYGLNAMTDGKSIVMADAATGLIDKYRQMGLQVYPVPIGEFQKSGGGVKCLTLDLRQS